MPDSDVEWFDLQRLRRCMRGDSWLSIDDMLRIDEVLGDPSLMALMRFPKTPLNGDAFVGQYRNWAAGE